MGGGPGSDIIFKTNNNSGFKKVSGAASGFGFAAGAPAFIFAGGINKPHLVNFDKNMDDDGEIRPSQIDEFIERKENKPSGCTESITMGVLASGHISNSYISIGDDDPFITGRF